MKKRITYKRNDIVNAIKLLNDCVVSMDRIASYSAITHKKNPEKMIIKYERKHKILQKLSKARTILHTAFSGKILKDDMSELENELKDIKYWSP